MLTVKDKMLTAYENKLKKSCLEVGVPYVPPDPGSDDEERRNSLYRLVARKRKKILLRGRILKKLREIKFKLHMRVASEIRNSIFPSIVCSGGALQGNGDFMHQRHHGLVGHPFTIPALQAPSEIKHLSRQNKGSITVSKTRLEPEPCITMSMPP